MKGELTLKILEFLEDAATTAFDLAVAMSAGGSFNRVNQEFDRRHFSRSSKTGQLKEAIRKRNNFCKLICKLKKEGLIAENVKGQLLSLTPRGREKIDALRRRSNRGLPPPVYAKNKDDKFKIVIFDIPERQRQKRNWLRSVLVGLDFAMLQKSVWLGKNKLPEDLLADLEKLELLPFVEIFEISKSGTVRSISAK